MRVQYVRGIHLPEAALWLDPHEARPVAVVSHAHADHVQQHDHVLTTVATAALMRRRGITRPRYRTLAFGRPCDLGRARVTLYPAGHILGSAQTLVESGDARLLYSGDFKLRAGRSAEPIQIPTADALIVETTFGRPRYRLPATEEVIEEIVAWCRDCLERRTPPVLFCYSLGKGQELLAHLEGVGFPIYLHSAHWSITSLYRELGRPLPQCYRFQPGQKLDGVLLCGSGCRRGRWFAQLGTVRTAYVSGWAMESCACRRFRTDAAFPLSDHADYADLLEYVRRTGARRVYTLHGFAEEFARDLRRQGLEADALREAGPQLELF